jgi:peptidoglycan/LPS O-acetylase OafA/YrhL
LALSLAATLPAAVLSYALIERPLLTLKDARLSLPGLRPRTSVDAAADRAS